LASLARFAGALFMECISILNWNTIDFWYKSQFFSGISRSGQRYLYFFPKRPSFAEGAKFFWGSIG
jgi:hypothetical protein